MLALSDRELQRNLWALARAIAQQELEGLKMPESTVADVNRAARGQIETDEIIRNIHLRFENVPIVQR